MKDHNNKKKMFRWDILFLIVGVVLLGAYGAITYYNASVEQHSQETVDQLRQIKESEVVEIQEPEESSSETEEDTDTKEKVGLGVLFEMNEDMAAWLTIPGMEIDYPVVQTPEDEEYYLRRDFFGEYDKNGTLLMDVDSNLYAQGTNIIIHGHNMRSGAMFGTLSEYEDSEYGKEHSQLLLYTREETREYELLAAFYSKVYATDADTFKYYQYFGAQDEAEFDEFYYNMKKLSLYDTGVTAEYGDELLTLSTCSYHTKDGRFVVVAKRVK